MTAVSGGAAAPEPDADGLGEAEAGAPTLVRYWIGDDDDGLRLDVFLGGLSEIGSRSRAASLCDAGLVSIDGRARPKSTRIEAGRYVEVRLAQPAAPEPPSPVPDVPVVFEDEWLLVVDKPAGMVVHRSKGHHSGTLTDAVASHGLAGGEAFRPGVVHRLDKGTSGLLVMAKDDAVHRALQRKIRERAIDRRYLALVHGDVTAATGTIEAPIGRDPARRKSMSVDGVAARMAVTHFTVLERLGGFTLVEARLETGRTHQIRVHFLAIGHPVAGDPTYARRDALDLRRQFLHSHRLTFEHPVTRAEVSCSSALPDALAHALERVRRDARS